MNQVCGKALELEEHATRMPGIVISALDEVSDLVGLACSVRTL
jgi:hypothetical protein